MRGSEASALDRGDFAPEALGVDEDFGFFLHLGGRGARGQSIRLRLIPGRRLLLVPRLCRPRLNSLGEDGLARFGQRG